MRDMLLATMGAFGFLALVGPSMAQTANTDAACQVEEAAVVLSCTVQSNGRMRDCEVLGVTPPNCGFEEAALEASEGARVDRSGQRGARAGQRVRFAVRYRPMAEGETVQPRP